MKPHLTIVSDDDGDWEALYVNGEQVAEGHSIRASDILDAAKKLDIITFEDKPGTAAMTGYSFPFLLEEVKYDPDYIEPSLDDN